MAGASDPGRAGDVEADWLLVSALAPQSSARTPRRSGACPTAKVLALPALLTLALLVMAGLILALAAGRQPPGRAGGRRGLLRLSSWPPAGPEDLDAGAMVGVVQCGLDVGQAVYRISEMALYIRDITGACRSTAVPVERAKCSAHVNGIFLDLFLIATTVAESVTDCAHHVDPPAVCTAIVTGMVGNVATVANAASETAAFCRQVPSAPFAPQFPIERRGARAGGGRLAPPGARAGGGALQRLIGQTRGAPAAGGAPSWGWAVAGGAGEPNRPGARRLDAGVWALGASAPLQAGADQNATLAHASTALAPPVTTHPYAPDTASTTYTGTTSAPATSTVTAPNVTTTHRHYPGHSTTRTVTGPPHHTGTRTTATVTGPPHHNITKTRTTCTHTHTSSTTTATATRTPHHPTRTRTPTTPPMPRTTTTPGGDPVACWVTVGQSGAFLARAAIGISQAAFLCGPVGPGPEGALAEKKCAVNIVGLLGGLAWMSRFLSLAVPACSGDEHTKAVVDDARARCAAGIAGIAAGFFSATAAATQLGDVCRPIARRLGRAAAAQAAPLPPPGASPAPAADGPGWDEVDALWGRLGAEMERLNLTAPPLPFWAT